MNTQFAYDNGNRALSGYNSMLLVKLPSETKYSLLLPLESTPSVFGDVDTFEFDLLTARTKGQVEGKESIEKKDVEFLLHRDNIIRLKALEGKALDFLVVYSDYTGYTFSGTIKVRPNDAESDVLKGTFSITPSTADPLMEDVRDLIKETVWFENTIVDEISFADKSKSETIVVQTTPTDATLEATCNNNKFTVTATQPTGSTPGNVVIGCEAGISGKQYGIVRITAKKNGSGTEEDPEYSPWTTTIAVSYKE